MNKTMDNKPLIVVEDLSKIYMLGKEKVIALNHINLMIHKGEIVCIFGKSGSGKSTLLNMLAGLEKPTKGKVLIGKTNISRLNEDKLALFRQRHIGFVFQSYNLMNVMTALENVAMPLMFKGMGSKRRNQIAKKVLEQVGLGDRIGHRPNQMSGGQQQRVGLARAFVGKPKIVFADEPTGNLDTKTTDEVMELIVGMARNFNQTIILVSHDPEIADYADRIIYLHDGKVDRIEARTALGEAILAEWMEGNPNFVESEMDDVHEELNQSQFLSETGFEVGGNELQEVMEDTVAKESAI